MIYLRSIYLENVGPIKLLDVALPFDGERPKPCVIVGANGSGKSVSLSFIVNFLISAKQEFYENTEVEKGKVFKLRNPTYIHAGAGHYYAKLIFDHNLTYEEWQLGNSKNDFEKAFGYKPTHASWSNIPEHASDFFSMPRGSKDLERALDENVTLYFPSNRFEEPAWLNERNLTATATTRMEPNLRGVSRRQIIANEPLGTLVNWIYDIAYDSRVFETKTVSIPIPQAGVPSALSVLTPPSGKNTNLINQIAKLLLLLFENKGAEQAQIAIGFKHNRQVGLKLFKDGNVLTEIPNVFALSTGESLLLTLFCAILRDFDLTGQPLEQFSDVSGIVIVDEIDLHLHVDLQRKVLPELLKLFPRVQFILTTHSPLFLIGMDETFGRDSYETLELPTGASISTERFVEFEKAYDAYRNTKLHETEIARLTANLTIPILVTEGASDKLILDNAWAKLSPSVRSAFQIVSVGTPSEAGHLSSGANALRQTLVFIAALYQKPIIGLFDNDRAGNDQFKGLTKAGFVDITPDLRKHKTKDVWALLLPVPDERKNFVSPNAPAQRYLELEHYFSDAVLAAHGKKGESILGTEVFEIIGDKMAFAEKTNSLDSSEFKNFALIFDRVHALFTPAPSTQVVVNTQDAGKNAEADVASNGLAQVKRI